MEIFAASSRIYLHCFLFSSGKDVDKLTLSLDIENYRDEKLS